MNKLLGFRSNTLWKKIISVCYLIGCVGMFCVLMFEGKYGKITTYDFMINKIQNVVMMIMWMSPYIFLSNTKLYQKLPLFKEGKWIKSILGLIIVNFILLVAFGMIENSHSKEYLADQKNHDYEIRNQTEQTCEQEGEITYLCNYCGNTHYESIPALGHDMQEVSKTEPTCDTEGIISERCTRCEYPTQRTLPVLGHEMEEVSKVETTCIEDGLLTEKCVRCDHSEETVLSALGHNMQEISKIEPTHEADGLLVKKCNNCDYTEETIIAALDEVKSEEVEILDKNTEKNTNTIGILGKDSSIYDLLSGSYGKGVEVTFYASYFSKRDSDNTYLFFYKEKDDEGRMFTTNIRISESGTNKILNILDDKDYKDDIAVKITGNFDKTIIHKIDDSDTMIEVYVKATKMEILDSDSKEARQIIGGYYYVGDKIFLSNDVVYTIKDAGKYIDEWGTYAYIDLEIDNQGDEDYSIYYTNCNFYQDDYLLPTVDVISSEDEFFSNTIAAGRKAVGKFYAECPEYDRANRLEVQFQGIEDMIIVILDETNNSASSQKNNYEDVEKVSEITWFAGIYKNNGISVTLKQGTEYSFDEIGLYEVVAGIEILKEDVVITASLRKEGDNHFLIFDEENAEIYGDMYLTESDLTITNSFYYNIDGVYKLETLFNKP